MKLLKTILALTIAALSPLGFSVETDERMMTLTGHTFEKVDADQLGESLRYIEITFGGELIRCRENITCGVLWGPAFTRTGDSLVRVTHQEAVNYCDDRNAELPREQDLRALRSFMLNQEGVYEAQVLPALDQGNSPHGFWPQTPDRLSPGMALGFIGTIGMFDADSVDLPAHGVRCIRR